MKKRNRDLSMTLVLTSGATTGDGVFTPTTGPMPSGDWDAVRVRWLLASGADVAGRPGVRYSADGRTWDTPAPLDASWLSPTTSFASLGSTSLPPSGTTEKALVQFGWFARRTGSGAVPLQVPIFWQVESVGKRARRVSFGPVNGATAQSLTPVFQPCTDDFAVGGLTQVRGTLELAATTTGCEAVLAYQLSADGETWGTAAALPGCSYTSSLGVSDGVWASLTTGANLRMRLGYLVKDTAGTPGEVNFVVVSGRVEAR